MSEMVNYVAPILALTIIVVCFLIFIDEAIQPMIDLGKTNQELADKMIVVAEKFDAVVNNRVSVTDIEPPTTGDILLPES